LELAEREEQRNGVPTNGLAARLKIERCSAKARIFAPSPRRVGSGFGPPEREKCWGCCGGSILGAGASSGGLD
ncbi:unnamed protein product, partial [Ectocarpus sp. 13 AM-2016]